MIEIRRGMMQNRCDVCGGRAWMEFSGREWNGKGWELVNKYLCPVHAKEWLRERVRNNKKTSPALSCG